MKARRYLKMNRIDILQQKKQYEPLIRRWILRMLVPGGFTEAFIRRPGVFQDDDVLRFIGLEELDGGNLSRRKTAKKIEHQWNVDEGNGDIEINDSVLEKNISKIGEALNLTELECKILHFVVLVKNCDLLDNTADLAGDMNREQVIKLLAVTLDEPMSEIRDAFHRRSSLHSSGLLQLERANYSLNLKVNLLEGLEDRVFSNQGSIFDLVRHLIVPAKEVNLVAHDFGHLAEKYDRISSYLRYALQRRIKGVNILIHGEPGVGKTGLVRTIAQSTDAACLYELSTVDGDGDPMNEKERFQAYQLSQKLLQSQPSSVILFDEIEDVFPTNPFEILFGMKSHGKQKGWVNELLEENLVPAFWVSNAIHQLDPAYLRRFDLVVEIKPMQHKARYAVLNKMLKGLPLSESWLSKMAHHKHLHPGQIQRAKKVVSCLVEDNAESDVIQHELETLIGETQVAMGNPKKPQQSSSVITPYSLSFLNADADLKRISVGLGKNQSGRLCLYGCPGSGKSGYANHLAEYLDKPLVSRKGSDLLGMYVGQTEQNIAAMFEQAEEEGAVLLLDEGDSFLMGRTGAHNHWEVTLVNELLTQMEQFEGIFVISTNLMDNLDAASLRRFDFKIKFDYMRPEQAWRMFKSVAKSEGVRRGIRSKDVEKGVMALDNITPGDFSTVIRKARVMGGVESGFDLLEDLRSECQMKLGDVKRRIGFV